MRGMQFLFDRALAALAPNHGLLSASPMRRPCPHLAVMHGTQAIALLPGGRGLPVLALPQTHGGISESAEKLGVHRLVEQLTTSPDRWIKKHSMEP